MVALLVILGLALLVTWTVMTFVCSWRVFSALCSEKGDRHLMLMLLIVTGGTGFGALTAIGGIWAAWIMLSAPFKLLLHMVPAPKPPPPAPVVVIPEKTLDQQFLDKHGLRWD